MQGCRARGISRHVSGLYASPRLERLLHSIGMSIVDEQPVQAPYGYEDQRTRVLHVLSYARPIGGDSRFAWRWIRNDTKRRHSVARPRNSNSAIGRPYRANCKRPWRRLAA